MYRNRISTFTILLTAAVTALAGGKGYLGIDISVEGEGVFWNPTLKSVKVARVLAGSSADKAGITAGDTIVEIEGKSVVGAKANDLQPYMQREIGQTVKLLVKKPTGEVKPISVVAGPKLD